MLGTGVVSPGRRGCLGEGYSGSSSEGQIFEAVEGIALVIEGEALSE